jgi:hypothetical protein
MSPHENDPMKTIRERMAAEDRVKECVDEAGNRWTKVYFGGGEHFRNWLEQCRELGEVMVEEVDATGFACYREGGEPLYRIWMKMDSAEHAD